MEDYREGYGEVRVRPPADAGGLWLHIVNTVGREGVGITWFYQKNFFDSLKHDYPIVLFSDLNRGSF